LFFLLGIHLKERHNKKKEQKGKHTFALHRSHGHLYPFPYLFSKKKARATLKRKQQQKKCRKKTSIFNKTRAKKKEERRNNTNRRRIKNTKMRGAKHAGAGVGHGQAKARVPRDGAERAHAAARRQLVVHDDVRVARAEQHRRVREDA
jgi:hypothetical protein